MKATDKERGNSGMLLKPKIDFVFEMLFRGAGEKSAFLLIDLLNSIMGFKGDKEITQIEYLSPGAKASTADIKVKSQSGDLFCVRMQTVNDDDYRKGGLYAWAELYSEYADPDAIDDESRKYIAIMITNFILLNERTKYHSIYTLQELSGGFEFLNDFELHYIELPKFQEKEDISDMSNLEKWLIFLKYAGEEGKEDIITKLKMKNKVFDMAYMTLKEISEDERIRQKYHQCKNGHDQTLINDVKRGLKEIEEGEVFEARDVIKDV